MENYLLSNEEKKVFITVKELTGKIKDLLENRFQNIGVIGEISNLNIHTSGHVYLSLKDESATIRAIIFKGYRTNIKFNLENGLKVRVIGELGLYSQRGEYQIKIRSIEPDGIGSLQLAFDQLKVKLESQGYFKKEYKKVLPKYPYSIGIVTSSTGAAIQDILNILNRRFTGLDIYIYPVRVQGDRSAEEIANAIRVANQDNNNIDVLIIGRGGGSIEDLWAFNEEVVAKAIFDSKIPIISAVGHEIDWTIADYVSDKRAPTPSAAAEIVVQDRKSILDLLKSYQNYLERFLKEKIRESKKQLNHYNMDYINRSFRRHIEEKKIRLDRSIEDFFRDFSLFFEGKKNILETYKLKVKNLNPEELLKKGYSFTYFKNKDGSKELINRKKVIKVKDTLEIHTLNKIINVNVQKVQEIYYK